MFWFLLRVAGGVISSPVVFPATCSANTDPCSTPSSIASGTVTSFFFVLLLVASLWSPVMVFACFWNDEFQLNDVIYFVCGVPGMKPKRKHCIDHERLVAVLMQKGIPLPNASRSAPDGYWFLVAQALSASSTPLQSIPMQCISIGWVTGIECKPLHRRTQ